MIKPTQHPLRKFLSPAIPLTTLLATILFCSAPAFAVSKDMVQLQTQIQELQDAVARLQQSNDERMGAMKDLIQQSADSINKMGANVDVMRKQLQTQQEAQGGKVDQVSGQIQSLNDSVDEIKARIATLQKLMQDVQNQQQSMSAGMPQPTGSSGPPPSNSAPLTSPAPDATLPANPATGTNGKRGKPSANVPQAADTPGPAVPPADQLYKTALGDYMAAKYPLASSEFGDVVKYYPDNPLSGNSFYYQAEINYRDAHYPAAIKAYDAVLEQYPDSNKVPASHLHKGIALFNMKENDAGTRELRTLIQRFPNSPEAMQARSKLSGMGIPVTPKR
jgi:TolA-binding protein